MNEAADAAATPVCIHPESPERESEAETLALRLGLGRCRDLDRWPGYALVLSATRTELRPCWPGSHGPIAAELASGRRTRGRDLLSRAAGRGHPTSGDAVAIDATAGLGGDSLALAALGYRVLAVERSPLLAELLADGLFRARQLEDSGLADRIELHRGDARLLIPELPRADLILLDPMFPAAAKSALKTKEMRALRALLGDDGDAHELLAVARRFVLRRVVVKRPRRGPALAGPAPSGSVVGTTVRFDLYPPQPR